MKRLMSAGLTIAMMLGATSAQAETVVLQRHTTLYTVLQQTLNSKTSHDGDRFSLVLKDGFFHHNPTAVAGAVIEGHIENDTPAGPTHKATMNVIFDDIKLPDGSTEPIVAKLDSVKTFEPRTHHLRDATLVIGGAVVGHVMGSHHGMKHGGLAGAAAGFALASAWKSDIVVKRNSQVWVKLTQDVVE